MVTCCTVKTNAQQNNYFRYPLDSVQQYISLFNALRDNHFHSGFDLKTQEKEGLPVLASADGYVSRIKIQSIGYGKAIYLDHPNGYTTVYGHLNEYAPSIGDWIKTYQYSNKTFEFDHVFKTPIFKVKKGDTIAYSGNSGRSTGPHVHFEIRETQSELPINPLQLGFPLVDTLSPQWHYLHFYTRSGYKLHRISSVKINTDKLIMLPNANRLLYTDTITIPINYFALGFEASDYLTDTTRKYMLYGAEFNMHQPQKSNIALATYSYQMNKASFSNMRVINRFIDYATYTKTGRRIQLAFLQPQSNYAFNYTNHISKGWINMDTNFLLQVDANITQYKPQHINYGNTLKNPSQLSVSFIVRYQHDSLYSVPQASDCMTVTNGVSLSLSSTQLMFNANTLYDTMNFCWNEQTAIKQSYIKPLQIGDVEVALQNAFTLKTKPLLNPNINKQQLCWVKDFKYQKTVWENGYLLCQPTAFGTFAIVADSVKPKITTKSFKRNKLFGDNIVFTISDNLSGIKNYNGYIDGEWEVFDYDAKNDLLCFLQTAKLASGAHTIKVVVTDNAGNTAVYKKKFIK